MKHIFSKRNKALLIELVRTDFKLRYQSSVLGYLWSLLRPLFMFVILYIVFVKFLRVGSSIPHYPVYLLLGIVMWNFFVEMTSQSLTAIVGRGDLIRKIKIPRWIIIIATSLSALINLALNLVVLVIFMAINKVDITNWALLFAPTVIQLYVVTLGVSFFLAAAYVKYRDVSYIWEVALQAGFYATPILYPLSIIPNLLVKKLLMLNPMAQITQDAKYELVTHQTTTVHQVFNGGPYTLIPYVLGLLIIIGGAAYFRKESKYFAENI